MSKRVVEQDIQNPRVKFLHCRVTKDGHIQSHGGMTVAYIMNEDNKVVGFSVAMCHLRDMFCRAVGRVKAAGRLRSGRYYQHHPEPMEERKFIAASRMAYSKQVENF